MIQGGHEHLVEWSPRTLDDVAFALQEALVVSELRPVTLLIT